MPRRWYRRATGNVSSFFVDVSLTSDNAATVLLLCMGPGPQKRGDRRRRCTRGSSRALVGMAANPFGAHQAGRHRAGRKGWSVPSILLRLGTRTPLHRRRVRSRRPPLHHPHRQRRRRKVERRRGDVPRHHTHCVVRPHDGIELDEPRRRHQRRLRQVARPCAGHRDVDQRGRPRRQAGQVPRDLRRKLTLWADGGCNSSITAPAASPHSPTASPPPDRTSPRRCFAPTRAPCCSTTLPH